MLKIAGADDISENEDTGGSDTGTDSDSASRNRREIRKTGRSVEFIHPKLKVYFSTFNYNLLSGK